MLTSSLRSTVPEVFHRTPIGVLMGCLLMALAGQAQAQNTPPAGYTLCAAEGQRCGFSGAANVVYGARTTWTQPRSFSGGAACSNTTFGDPLVGVVKACYVQLASAPGPVPVSLSLRLAWIAPQVNADGSPLADLAGYRVKVRSLGGSHTRIIQVDSPHTLSATVTGLPSGTYSVVVTAIDASNNESAASNEVVKVLK